MTAPLFVRQKKPKRKHSVVFDWLAYVGLRFLVVILHLSSVESNLRFARFLGRLMWKHYHRGRQRALDNLKASFPDKDEQWYDAVGRKSCESIAMLAVDMFFTPKLVRKDNWRQYSRFKNVERAKWLSKENKGLIFVTGHYGNFEILGYMMGLFGFNVYSIARPLDNPFISRYLYGVRERAGQKIIDKKGAAEMFDKVASSGASISFIADQDAGQKGIFVDFFGRKASTYKSIGLLAITNNIPIVIGYGRRIDNHFLFEIGVNRIIYPSEWADKDDALRWVTAEYTKAIEDFIREDPTQYWWIHRRWKHRPKDEQVGQVIPAAGGR
jgi:Kdo2-lipid IVA lauroyltransferase/acyltransferase